MDSVTKDLIADMIESGQGAVTGRARTWLNSQVAEALATALAEREADRAEIARLTQALEAFGGEAAIEAKRLFDRMLATPRHTDKRRQLAAQHYEASKRAALARATLSDSQQ